MRLQIRCIGTMQLRDVIREDIELERAVKWLLDRQDPGGWWTAELETNVTMTAEHVMLLTFLGEDTAPVRAGAIRHFIENQRDDGSWALFFDGPGDVSTTIEAYFALKLLGVSPSEHAMEKALTFILSQGGVVESRVFTKIWLALFGKYPWEGIPSMPPELVHLPPFVPLNLYDFACWARGTIAGLLIVISRRPIRPVGVDVEELVLPGTESRLTEIPGSGIFWWADKALKLYERLPLQPGRNLSRGRVAEWIVRRQEADGSWGGIQPPWVYSLIALHLEGMPIDHPVIRKGLQGLEGFSVHDERGWRLQACMSPVWDTALAVLALRRAGVGRDHIAMEKSVRWLLNEQISSWGDWQVRAPGVVSGGWAFEFANDIYPDIDDTAIVVLALLDASDGSEAEAAIDRARRWILGMRSKNGAWGAFDKNNTRGIVYKLPFADFGAMLDPPSEDVTAHVLEMLACLGYSVRDRIVSESIGYLRQTQRAQGPWFGRWGVNYIYGSWSVIQALASFKQRTGSMQTMIDRATTWIIRHQNVDGGWGETCLSYEDESFAGVGDSTASQTAWAVLGLQSAGLTNHPSAKQGLDYLRRSQHDGTWAEPQYTGTGFPRDFYINYHLYRHIFPTMALAGSSS